jgi:uncharacterized protein with PCYCGC motif
MRFPLLLLLVGSCTGSTGGAADARVDLGAVSEAPLDATGDLRPDGPPECLGTMYPGIGPIDPDAPVFSDANWTQDEVTAAFLEAKAQNSDAYRAYKAALLLGDILECAFCTCGCHESIGHLSSADCYKDMHGFG